MKRFFDIVVSLAALVLLSPVLLMLCVLVRVKIGPDVFFRQKRIGFRGKEFVIIKFRTMEERKDESGALLPDSLRTTPFGRLLRATSLDELPELWNVLKGDMSFVGPRPLDAANRPRYTPEQFRRHDVMPGITGWAQINGRNEISWNDRLVLDLWYVENHSFRLDMAILFKTFIDVVRETGINNEAGTGIPFEANSPSVINTSSVAKNFKRFLGDSWHLVMRCLSDIVLIIFSLYLAYQIRFGFKYLTIAKQVPYFPKHAFMLVVFIFGTLLVSGSYRNMWRFYGMTDIFRYMLCFSVSSVLLFAWRFAFTNVYPRAVPLTTLGLSLVISFWLLLSARLLRRASGLRPVWARRPRPT